MDMSTHSTTMQNYFTTSYVNTPLLFSTLVPSTPGALFAIWFGIFFTAIVYRGLTFLRTYLEATTWSPSTTANNSSGDSILKQPVRRYVQPFSLQRDGSRALLTFVTATVGYALMLVVMSFVVAYFFAVVVGLAVGELVFARLGVRVEEGHH